MLPNAPANNKLIGGSFRDPAGFLYRQDGRLLRQVNKVHAEHYDACVNSGLFDRLIAANLLISHQEVEDAGMAVGMYKVLAPEEISYVSYPYEWSFSLLRDAALLTLEIQKMSLEFGLCLKDASAFNIQFNQGRPVFIDSLSFERYDEGKPWVAYRQFCQHFLAPLTLMAEIDLRLRQLSFRYIDGPPLDLTSRLLPKSTYFKYSTLAHIHMHARSQEAHQDSARTGQNRSTARLSKRMMLALMASLTSAVEKLSPKDVSTEWGEYYLDTNYTESAMRHKETVLSDFASRYLGDIVVHDLGANTGRFSRIVAKHARYVVAHDIDEMAVERHYRDVRARKDSNILPLILDLGNPSPALGWNLDERSSFKDRSRSSAAVALALVHHLCITNNVPFQRLAEFFSESFKSLVIEFVPKDDSQVQRLLATRRDVFADYTTEGFEHAFARHFDIQQRCPINESKRIMYAMTARAT